MNSANRRLLCLAAVWLAFAGALRAAPVTFQTDVAAVISKAGCNLGTCHGNATGKGGFKLSLRGGDPDYDFAALVQDQFGRRVNTTSPEESLLLLKATQAVAHEGGKRFDKDSWEYRTLREWLTAGARRESPGAPTLATLEVTPSERVLIEPASSVEVKVTAKFSDGSTRDVTKIACYEVVSVAVAEVSTHGRVTRKESGETTLLVRFLHLQEPVRLAFVPARPGYKWANAQPHNFIDREIYAKLQTLRMNPSALASDEVFLRRAYLDLLGILPTAEEARKFVGSSASPLSLAPGFSPVNPAPKNTSAAEAASRTSEAVKTAPRFGTTSTGLKPGANERMLTKRAALSDELLERPEFADFWALKWADLLRVEEKALDSKGVQDFHRWLRASIAGNKPMDQFARELIASRGSTYANPEANFYRANRTPVIRAEAAAQVFLGTRLQCAQCHNHPFDRWTQDDYYDWAALFARVDYKILKNARRDTNDKHEFVGEQIVYLARKGSVTNPRTEKSAEPRFLGAAKMDFDKQDELEALAVWVTRPDNPLFARAQVNRIWFHLMGRGIVDPIDDFRATNPASHPALLAALSGEFVQSGFSLKHVIRLVMNSRSYQTASEPNETNRDDELNYARASVRRLTAEQLFDTLHQVTGVTPEFRNFPAGTRAAELPGARLEGRRGRRTQLSPDAFMAIFGKPPRITTCDCERSAETTMGQAFQMISGPAVNELLTQSDNRLGPLLEAVKSNRDLVTELYWSVLTRAPSETELTKTLAHIEQAKDRRSGTEDVLWGLVNAKEFVLRR
ncbi:MAG: DUF1553 domain-containing protein [Verrucomicrobia bacterium]|nr:DUF1553 domain-containing protein [Verrucomicrobiota bacterium]